MTDESKKKKTAIKTILSKITEFKQGVRSNSHAMPGNEYDLLAWVKEDPLLRAAIEIKHATITKVGYYLSNATKADEQRLSDLRFYKWNNQSLWQECIYLNSFTELPRDSNNKINHLKIIKTDEVEILNKPTGEVTGYLQLPTNPENNKFVISLPKDNVFHLVHNQLSTSLWGDSTLNTAIPILKKKKLIEDYINWLFESNQFRTVIQIPIGVLEEDIDAYIETIKQGMLNPTNFLVLQGESAIVTTLRKIEGFGELLQLLDYYRSQLLALLQLPPIQIGILESSNRSSSEYQVRYSFYTSIISFMRNRADEINNELFPRLGLKCKLVPNLVDDVAKNSILDMAQKLANLNANPKKLNRWLVDNGFNIPLDLLEEPKESIVSNPEFLNNDKEDANTKRLKLDKNSDLHPSRQKTQMDFAGGSRNK